MDQASAKDRISELPDAVLCYILSFLQTKDVLRTSILSTRWKNTWMSVPNLDFYDEAKSDKNGFVIFVNHVLSLRESDIRKFRLHCSCVDDFSHIDGWIRTAIKHNVAEVDLFVKSVRQQILEFVAEDNLFVEPEFFAEDDLFVEPEFVGEDDLFVELDQEQILELPRPLFVCKTLEVLKLKSNCSMNLPLSGCFPSLKFLQITVDSPVGSDSLGLLFSHCPVLEDLTLDGTLGVYVLHLNISAAELKTLRIRLRSTADGIHDAHNFIIDSPKLENLDIEEDILSNYRLENANSLIKAHARVYDTVGHLDISKRAAALMSAISNVLYLSLSAKCLKDLSLPSALGNVSQLKLVLTYCNYMELPKFLKSFPSLTHLILEYGAIHMDKVSEDERMLTESVPSCPMSFLKTIFIRKVKEDPGYMDKYFLKYLLKYLLMNGEMLEKITIYTGGLLRTKELYKEVSMFQMGSNTCRVEFI